MAQHNHNIEVNSTVLGIIVIILIILGAMWLGGNSEDASPDPQCVSTGNC